MTLRSQLIRLAYADPDLREDLIPVLTKTAGVTSLKDGINQALGEFASEMGKFLVRKYPDAFAKMSKNPFSAGEFAQGVAAEIKNQYEPSRVGDIGVEALWRLGQDRYPLIRVWARFPNPPRGKAVKGYEREVAFKLGESPSSAVGRLGAVFVRDLDTWMVGVTTAYAQSS